MKEVALLLSVLPLFSCFVLNKNDPNNSSSINPLAVCEIDVRLLHQRHPLLRNPFEGGWILPDSAGSSIVTLTSGALVEMDCPGSANIVAGSETHSDLAIATCISGSSFLIAGQVNNIYDVICSRKTTSTARYTGKSCFGHGKEIEVGWLFSDGHFIEEMTTCFDDVNRHVLYSAFVMTHQIGDKATGGIRPAWTEGSFYRLGTALNNLYPNAAHRLTINRQLGLADDDTTYVKPTGSYYIAKGHLTANADFIYMPQQEATHHYINSNPQWQTFNGFNWAYFESNVRQLASRTGHDLQILTGTYGISTLPHAQTGKPVELYLFVDSSGNKAIPIPEVFWKVVYDPESKAGVAVLGLNNPYQTDVLKSVYCNDIADQLTWLTFDRFNAVRGYTYACTVDDLRKILPHIPKYDIRRVLT